MTRIISAKCSYNVTKTNDFITILTRFVHNSISAQKGALNAHWLSGFWLFTILIYHSFYAIDYRRSNAIGTNKSASGDFVTQRVNYYVTGFKKNIYFFFHKNYVVSSDVEMTFDVFQVKSIMIKKTADFLNDLAHFMGF